MSRKTRIVSNRYSPHNLVKIIRAGKGYFDTLLQLINQAQESIYIQTYIYGDDETGRLMANALKEAVKRKVVVYLMADGYASQALSQSFIEEIKTAGINFRFFEPLLKSTHFYFGRRLHHKVVVVDEKYALVGGINIADRYNDMPGIPAWLDFALYVEGEIAKPLSLICRKTWQGYTGKVRIKPEEKKQITFSSLQQNISEVRVRRNDWVRRKKEISRTYIEMLRTSKSQVTILCSYFLPGRVIRRQILYAIKRGVTIKLIAAGSSDVMVSKHAERWLYDWLLRNGVKLYEYQKTVLHGKVAVCDDSWITVGSYNINNISANASIELNLDVRNAAIAKELSTMLEKIIANDCICITPENHSKAKNIFNQLVRWASYEFIRISLYLFTFYFKQER